MITNEPIIHDACDDPRRSGVAGELASDRVTNAVNGVADSAHRSGSAAIADVAKRRTNRLHLPRMIHGTPRDVEGAAMRFQPDATLLLGRIVR